MTQNLWIQLTKTDFAFSQLLSEIVNRGEVSTSDVVSNLQTPAKFELIRMESFEIIKFEKGIITLGEHSESLTKIYLESTLQSVG